jgi:hypothetical protein
VKIKLIDKTLNVDLGFMKKRHLENFALMAIRKFYKKFHVSLNVAYFICVKYMVQFFYV